MTRKNVVDKIFSIYSDPDTGEEWIYNAIYRGEQEGISYETIYTGLHITVNAETNISDSEYSQDLINMFSIISEEIDMILLEAQTIQKKVSYRIGELNQERLTVLPGGIKECRL